MFSHVPYLSRHLDLILIIESENPLVNIVTAFSTDRIFKKIYVSNLNSSRTFPVYEKKHVKQLPDVEKN